MLDKRVGKYDGGVRVMVITGASKLSVQTYIKLTKVKGRIERSLNIWSQLYNYENIENLHAAEQEGKSLADQVVQCKKKFPISASSSSPWPGS